MKRTLHPALALLVLSLAALVVPACTGGAGADDEALASQSLAANTTCTKDPQVLARLLTTPLTCDRDDDCPTGAYCNGVSRTCGFTCGPTTACTRAGEVCDCTGRCVAATGSTIPVAVPELAAAQKILDLSGANQSATLDLSLATTEVALTTSAAKQPVVQVLAPQGLEASCNGGASFAPACNLPAWSYAAPTVTGAAYVARQKVTVRRTASGPQASGNDVRVVVGAQDVTNGRFEIPVELGAAVPAGEPGSLDGEWKGQLTVLGGSEGALVDARASVQITSAIYGANCGGQANVTSAVQAACATGTSCSYTVDYTVIGDPAPGCGKDFRVSYTCAGDSEPRVAFAPGEAGWRSTVQMSCDDVVAAAAPLVDPVIPVRAYGRGDNVLIVDDTRTIAPSGRLLVNKKAFVGAYYERWLAARPARQGSTDQDSGALDAMIVSEGIRWTSERGQVTGSARVVLPTPQRGVRVRFVLTRQGSAAPFTCSAGACSGTASCDTRIDACVGGTTPVAGSGIVSSFVQQKLSQWGDAAQSFYFDNEDPRGWLPPFGDHSAYSVGYYQKVNGEYARPDVLGMAHRDPAANWGFIDYGDLNSPPEPGGAGMELCKQFIDAVNTNSTTNQYWSPWTLRNRPGNVICPTGPDDGLPYGGLSHYGTCHNDYNCEYNASRTEACTKLYTIYRPRTTFPQTFCGRRAPTAAETRDLMERTMPCVDDPTGALDARPTRTELRCSRLFARAQDGGDTSASYAAYLSGKCMLADEYYTEIGGAKLNVYLCPVQEVVFGNQGGETSAEQLACFDPTTNPYDAFSSRLGQTTYADTNRELRCRNGHQPQTFNADFYADRVAAGKPRLKGTEMAEACRAELLRKPPASFSYDRNTRWFEETRCVSLPRLLPGLLDAATQPRAYFLRLLQGWIAVHDRYALEAVKKWKYDRSLYGIDAQVSQPVTAAGLEEMLDLLERRWDLFFDPRIATALAGMPDQTFVDLDYRMWRQGPNGLVTKPTDDAARGLPTALLEGAAAHLRALQTYVEQSRWDTFGDCQAGRATVLREAVRERIGTTLRYVLAVRSLAANLETRASRASGGSNHRWLAGYRDALRELVALEAQVTTAAGQLNACQNPLGVDDNTVPMVFGDHAGANSIFFALSDYLLSVADSAVTTATSSLTTARTAWRQSFDSTIADIVNDPAGRLEKVQTKYGDPLIRLCGLTGYESRNVLDAFARGELKPETCHLKTPTCPDPRSASCYRGEIGESVLALASANQDITIAQRQYADHVETYDHKFNYCRNLQVYNDQNAQLLQQHLAHVRKLREESRLFGKIASWVSMIVACTAGSVVTAGAAAVVCGGALTTYMTSNIQADASNDLEESNENFAAEMESRKAKFGEFTCFDEADAATIGIRTNWEQIIKRAIDAQGAILKLSNQQAEVRQLVSEGLAAVARERERLVPEVAFHFWVDESVDTFQRDLLWAKSVTYLALQAVEFELQTQIVDWGNGAGVTLRSKIVGARNAAQLGDVIQLLKTAKLSRGFGGIAPREDFVLVSLKEILSIYDRTGQVLSPAGTPQTSTAARLRARILSPDSAIYDAQGKYVGQGIPFTLAPTGKLANECAERITRVSIDMTASPLGFGWSATRGPAPAILYKRNTAASQWCQGADAPEVGESPFQVSTVLPRRFLLGSGVSAGNPGDAASYATASVYAPIPRPSTDAFYSEGFTGGSSELQNRGLYGDYILVLPWRGLLEFGFNMAALDNVLIRFDHVAIAKNPIVR